MSRWKLGEYNEIIDCPENIKYIAECLLEGKTMIWNLSMPCRTRYEVTISPQTNTVGDRWEGCNSMFFMVAITRRGAYPFNFMGQIHSSYLNEKLNIGQPEAKDLSDIFYRIGEAMKI